MVGIVGEFTCGNCETTVDLKKDKGGKFYYHCDCGQHFMRGKRGADIVLTKGIIFGAARNVTETAPASPAPVVEKTPLRKGPLAPPKPKPVTPPAPPVAEKQQPEKLTFL